jgi:hypothetical protein
MRLPAVPATPPFLVMMQCSQGFYVRHMLLFEFAEVVASVLVQGDDAMSVSVYIFIFEKGAFAAFAGSYHVLIRFVGYSLSSFSASPVGSRMNPLPYFGAADIFKDHDGNISVGLASNQPTAGRDADLNFIGAFHWVLSIF